MSSAIRFIHLSDTHFGPTKDFVFHGKVPYQDGLRLVDEINRFPIKPDFIIHTGDLISFQHPDAYELAAEVLKEIKIPMYFVSGNHDEPALLSSFPLFAPKTLLGDNPTAVNYYFELKNHLFITIDAKHPDDNNPSGVIDEKIIVELKNLISRSKKPFTIFTHFPPLPIDAPWMDENLLISNGDALHTIAKQFASLSRGIFFGHIHQPLQVAADGVTYFSAPSSTFQFGGWPDDVKILSYNTSGVAGLNLVSIIGNQVITKYLNLPISRISGGKKF